MDAGSTTDQTDRTPQELADTTALLVPLTNKIVTEMRKERGAENLTDQFLYALAARACVAAGAYMGDPRSILRSVDKRLCPDCGEEYRKVAGGWSCRHTSGCSYTWKRDSW